MKITISSSALLSALNRARAATMAVSSNPMLSCFKLEAEGDTLTVTGTNMDTAISTEAPCNLLAKGGVCVNAQRLFALASELGSGDVELSTDDKYTLVIKHGRNINRLVGVHVRDFPPVPDFGEGQSFKIDQPVLKAIISRLHPFASTDQSLYIINSILLDGSEEGAVAVATDKRTMRSVPFLANFKGQFVIPSNAAKVISGACDGQGEVEVSLDESAIRVTSDGWSICSKLIEGAYPNWRRLLTGREDGAAELVAPVDALLAAMRKAEVTAGGEAGSRTVILSLSPQECSVRSEHADLGSGEEFVDGASCSRELEIRFGVQYFRTLVKSCPNELIHLYFTTPEQAVHMDDESGRGITMPIKLQ